MRIRLILFFLAILGTAHFAASPIATKLFNETAAQCIRPAFCVEKVSLDLINAQANLHDLRLAAPNPEDPPLAEIRDAILHWALLPVFSLRCELKEISLSGANCTLVVREEDPTPWNHLAWAWPGSPTAPYPIVPALLQASWVTHTWSTLKGEIPKVPYRAHSVALPAALPYTLEKKNGDTTVHYPAQGPSLLVHDVYLADFSLRMVDRNPQKPVLPTLTNCSVRARNVAALLAPDKQPMEFTAQGKFEGQDASYIKAEGSVRRNENGLNGTCDFVFEGLDMAKLWPWINPSWLPAEYAQFDVTEGIMDIKSHLRIMENRWYLQNNVTLKKLKVRVHANGPYRKIQGASPELIVRAINTLGEANLQFATLPQWREAFRENAMKGVRNLIRNSIRDALMGNRA